MPVTGTGTYSKVPVTGTSTFFLKVPVPITGTGTYSKVPVTGTEVPISAPAPAPTLCA